MCPSGLHSFYLSSKYTPNPLSLSWIISTFWKLRVSLPYILTNTVVNFILAFGANGWNNGSTNLWKIITKLVNDYFRKISFRFHQPSTPSIYNQHLQKTALLLLDLTPLTTILRMFPVHPLKNEVLSFVLSQYANIWINVSIILGILVTKIILILDNFSPLFQLITNM